MQTTHRLKAKHSFGEKILQLFKIHGAGAAQGFMLYRASAGARYANMEVVVWLDAPAEGIISMGTW